MIRPEGCVCGGLCSGHPTAFHHRQPGPQTQVCPVLRGATWERKLFSCPKGSCVLGVEMCPQKGMLRSELAEATNVILFGNRSLQMRLRRKFTGGRTRAGPSPVGP